VGGAGVGSSAVVVWGGCLRRFVVWRRDSHPDIRPGQGGRCGPRAAVGVGRRHAGHRSGPKCHANRPSCADRWRLDVAQEHQGAIGCPGAPASADQWHFGVARRPRAAIGLRGAPASPSIPPTASSCRRGTRRRRWSPRGARRGRSVALRGRQAPPSCHRCGVEGAPPWPGFRSGCESLHQAPQRRRHPPQTTTADEPTPAPPTPARRSQCKTHSAPHHQPQPAPDATNAAPHSAGPQPSIIRFARSARWNPRRVSSSYSDVSSSSSSREMRW